MRISLLVRIIFDRPSVHIFHNKSMILLLYLEMLIFIISQMLIYLKLMKNYIINDEKKQNN